MNSLTNTPAGMGGLGPSKQFSNDTRFPAAAAQTQYNDTPMRNVHFSQMNMTQPNFQAAQSSKPMPNPPNFTQTYSSMHGSVYNTPVPKEPMNPRPNPNQI